MKFHTLCLASCIAGASLLPNAAIAAPSGDLNDGNSQILINAGTSAGVHYWNIDGQNVLGQLSSFYRVGGAGGESPISAISLPTLSTPDAKTLDVTYTSPNFTLQVVYSLLGGAPGSGVADLAQQVRIDNLTGGTLDFHFFQYADFDLMGAGGDSVILGFNPIVGYNEAMQSDGISMLTSFSTPGADRAEAALFGPTWASLNDGSPTTLNNVTTAGPGDVVWAWQYDLTIAAGGSVVLSQGFNVAVIPEPSAWAFGTLGVLALGMFRRFGRK